MGTMNPIVAGAGLLTALALVTLVNWVQSHELVILLVLRDALAVFLVLVAYRLVVAAVRGGRRVVSQPAPDDWFARYRPDESAPARPVLAVDDPPVMIPRPAARVPVPEAGLAPVIPLRRPEPAKTEVPG